MTFTCSSLCASCLLASAMKDLETLQKTRGNICGELIVKSLFHNEHFPLMFSKKRFHLSNLWVLKWFNLFADRSLQLSLSSNTVRVILLFAHSKPRDLKSWKLTSILCNQWRWSDKHVKYFSESLLFVTVFQTIPSSALFKRIVLM